MSKLSITVITKNEEKNIRRCLESVKWADEIIILDSGSTDATIEICKEYTEKIWKTDWPGYGIQKQRALEKATCDWVLSIDADEEITPELAKSIKMVISSGDDSPKSSMKYKGYKVKRRVMFAGQRIRYANATCKIMRLAFRENAHFSLSEVHESFLVEGGIGVLKGDMLHYSMPSIHAMLEKMNLYTELSAQKRAKKGKRGGVWRAALSALWMFFRVYVLDGGFLDGRAGFVLAVRFAEGSFYRYVKLYYLHKV